MDIQSAKRKAAKLLASKIETKILEICPITGIALTIEIPYIEGIVLEYYNPLAKYKNFIKFAELPTQKLQHLDQNILAGLVLATLNFHNLLKTKHTIPEINLNLQSVHPLSLIEAFKFYASIPPDNKKVLPKINIELKDETERQKSSINDVLKAHVEACKSVLYEEKVNLAILYNEVERIAAEKLLKSKKEKAIERARRTKIALQREAINEAKKYIAILKKNDTINQTIISYCEKLFDGMPPYIMVAEQETKNRIATTLAIYPYEEAAALRKIIIGEAFSQNPEMLFIQDNDLEMEEELQVVEQAVKVEMPKKTLKEIIADKIAGKRK